MINSFINICFFVQVSFFRSEKCFVLVKKNVKKSQSHGRAVSRQWYSETGREGIPPEIPSLPVDVLTNQRASYN